MNEERSHRAAVRLRGEDRTFEIIRPTTGRHTMLEQLEIARRAAQAAANSAYDDWTAQLTSEAYAVYRAAQDRADAAQDRLAACARRAARDPRG
jgi:hypothetical protein